MSKARKSRLRRADQKKFMAAHEKPYKSSATPLLQDKVVVNEKTPSPRLTPQKVKLSVGLPWQQKLIFAGAFFVPFGALLAWFIFYTRAFTVVWGAFFASGSSLGAGLASVTFTIAVTNFLVGRKRPEQKQPRVQRSRKQKWQIFFILLLALIVVVTTFGAGLAALFNPGTPVP